jgi:hypothetical protein
MRLSLSASLLVVGALQVSAFWRMPCRARSGLARIDPLVSNGSLSEHAHAIHGSDGKSFILDLLLLRAILAIWAPKCQEMHAIQHFIASSHYLEASHTNTLL